VVEYLGLNVEEFAEACPICALLRGDSGKLNAEFEGVPESPALVGGDKAGMIRVGERANTGEDRSATRRSFRSDCIEFLLSSTLLG
jgi:hypothetical protein